MQKKKLKKFSSFVHTLLPHECSYLLYRQKSKDPERVAIMERVYHNVVNSHDFRPFDTSIDKRKYSKMLSWMQSSLDKINVDKTLEWISDTQKDILTDSVSPELDAEILKKSKHLESHDYNFMRFYEMLQAYRHYLLIRMRYNDHSKIDALLGKYHFDYQQSILVYEQMHQATLDIIGSGGENRKEAIHWKRWLLEKFKDDKLDGLNRYMAAIRYIFICLRYNTLDDYEAILKSLDAFFQNGRNYSKRILVNFYDNMLVLFDKKDDYEKAKYYGYLSIKYDQPDAIIYRNNLVNVLIKNKAFAEGLRVIEDAEFKISSTKNFHSVVGFVSNYIRCLTKVNRIKEAISKGRIFFNAYAKSILKYRWHRFFAAYHGALLSGEEYEQIIKNTEKYSLQDKEMQGSKDKGKSQYILNIYYLLSLIQTNKMSAADFKTAMRGILDGLDLESYDIELQQIIQHYLEAER